MNNEQIAQNQSTENISEWNENDKVTNQPACENGVCPMPAPAETENETKDDAMIDQEQPTNQMVASCVVIIFEIM